MSSPRKRKAESGDSGLLQRIQQEFEEQIGSRSWAEIVEEELSNNPIHRHQSSDGAKKTAESAKTLYTKRQQTKINDELTESLSERVSLTWSRSRYDNEPAADVRRSPRKALTGVDANSPKRKASGVDAVVIQTSSQSARSRPTRQAEKPTSDASQKHTQAPLTPSKQSSKRQSVRNDSQSSSTGPSPRKRARPEPLAQSSPQSSSGYSLRHRTGGRNVELPILHSPIRGTMSPSTPKYMSGDVLPPSYVKPKCGWEYDEKTLVRRTKEIIKTKQKDHYQQFIKEVPFNKRTKGVHPRTPNKFLIWSRRSWDMQMRIWKKMIPHWKELSGGAHNLSELTDLDASYMSTTSSIGTPSSTPVQPARKLARRQQLPTARLLERETAGYTSEVDCDYTPSSTEAEDTDIDIDLEIDRSELNHLAEAEEAGGTMTGVDDEEGMLMGLAVPVTGEESTMTGLVRKTKGALDFSGMQD